MKLYYWEDTKGLKNFGDDLNPWLWQKFMPGVFDDDSSTVFIGIGTLLNAEHLPKAETRIVFSSGVGYGTTPVIDPSWKIYCVRGPLSARELGVSDDLAITDGAILVQKYFKPAGHKKFRFSFMPHCYQDRDGGTALRYVCDALGFQYIDPQWPVEKVLYSIGQTEVLMAEAMHGAIAADALRVPWIPLKFTANIFEFKWRDWCGAMDVEYLPQSVLPLWNLPPAPNFIVNTRHLIKAKLVKEQLAKIAKKARPVLSKQSVFDQRLGRLEEKAAQFKADRKAGVFNHRGG